MAAPDIVRVIACFSVMTIHFFLNSGYYYTPLKGFGMIFMLGVRLLVTVCVPLFLMLTGYLMVNKPLSKSHYPKGMKVIWIYLLASIACLIYVLYFKDRVGSTLTTPTPEAVKDAWLGILSFKTARYSWYVEMYIGLYLLIPFLNILFRHLPNKRWRLVLIVTLFCMTSLPAVLNTNNLVVEGWFQDPTLSTEYHKIIPSFWTSLYPLAYYFIGAYIRLHGVQTKKLWLGLAAVIALGAAIGYNLWRRTDQGFYGGGPWNDWTSPFTFALAIPVFALLISKEYRRLPKWLGKVISYVSSLSLGMFLVSFIFDTEFYRILQKEIPAVQNRLWTSIVIVPLVFVCSFVLAAIIDLIYRLMMLTYRKAKEAIKKSLEKNRSTESSTESPESPTKSPESPEE